MRESRPGYKILEKGKIYIHKTTKGVMRMTSDTEMPNFKAAEWEEKK